MKRLSLAKRIAVCLALVLLTGCSKQEQFEGKTVEREGQPAIVYVKGDNPDRVNAIETARSTLDQFRTAFDDPQPAYTQFSVKVLFEEGEQAEHMWTQPIRFEGEEYVGLLSNIPYHITNLKLGDEVRVPVSQISDWKYLDAGVLQGGYTLRAYRDQLSDEERKAFDQKYPYKFE